MTDNEKKDMLIEQLAMLYRIKEGSKEDNKVLDHEIQLTEFRLEAMGVTDFSRIK